VGFDLGYNPESPGRAEEPGAVAASDFLPADFSRRGKVFSLRAAAGTTKQASAPPGVLQTFATSETLIMPIGNLFRKWRQGRKKAVLDEFVLTDPTKLTPEQSDWLCNKLSLPSAVLRSYLELLEVHQVSTVNTDITLRDMASQYGETKKQLEKLMADDPTIQPLIEQALEALEQAQWPRAESLLNDAATQNIEAAESAPVKKQRERLFSAASAKASNGRLKRSELAHWKSADYYRQAAELVPAVEPLIRAGYHVCQGYGLMFCGEYPEAEGSLTLALEIRERELAADSLDVAECLYLLGRLYQIQGRYAEAAPLHQRSLAIREKVLGPEHPDLAKSLNSLAALYQDQGHYAKAEPLYRRSLPIDEKMLGPEHPQVASSLNNLAAVYEAQGNYAEAEPLYLQSLAIREKVLGPLHPHVADSLNSLATLYKTLGKYSHAEPLYRHSLAIREKVLGPGHPQVADSLNNLALLYEAQGKYGDAEPLCRRSLAVREKVLGPKHPQVVASLKNYAILLQKIGRNSEAEEMLARVRAIREGT
jgi:tetratricopeptide (TPR) repeat protein